MGKHERIVSTEPPAPRAPGVLVYLDASKRVLAGLETEVAEAALAAAEETPGAQEKLALLYGKIGVAKFEIDSNAKAHDLAQRLDRQAVEDWKTAIQAMPPEKIIAGITASSCCRLCSADTGCVITAGQNCAHPVKTGVLPVRLADNPAIRKIFAAACAKTGVARR
jgi:hypothetical protein